MNPEIIAGVSLLLGSVFINTLGATSHATWVWNQRPKEIDNYPERLWDWRQPQFLAGYLPYPPPSNVPFLSGRIDFSSEASEGLLWHGWFRTAEGELWAEREAAIVFKLPENKPTVILLNLNPFLMPGKVDSLHVDVTLNEQPLTQLHVYAPNTYSVTIPAHVLRGINTLTLKAPEAQSPLALGISNDPRPRSVNLRGLETSNGTDTVQVFQPGVE